MKINASLKPRSGKLTKGSEPEAAILMLLRSLSSKMCSVRGTADDLVQQHNSQHPWLTALCTWASHIHQALLH